MSLTSTKSTDGTGSGAEGGLPPGGLWNRLYRLLAPITLLEWGGILIYFYWSGRLSAFLHPSFRPLVPLTGTLLALSAACIFLDALGPNGTDADSAHDCNETDCDHSRAKLTLGGALAFAILLLPIVLAARISPDSYGATLLRNRGIAVQHAESVATPPAKTTEAAAPNEAPVSIPGEKPVAVEVGDLLMATESLEAMQRWAGKRVILTGQCLATGGNSYDLVRLLILCCAADAQPLAVRVDAPPQKGAFSEMGWASVVGTVSFIKKGDATVPMISAETITPIPQPAEPYVYRGGAKPVQHRPTTMKLQLPPK